MMQEGRLKEIKLGFIGAGAMGGALMRGLVAAGVPPAHLTFYDPDPQRRQDLETLGIAPARDNPEVMQFPVVVLAVKPQVIDQALGEIQGSAREQHLIISIAAGVPLSRLEAALPQARLIRAMPNTPLLVQEGMTGLAPGSRARPEDLSLALELFGTVGRAVVVEDKLLDAVTALSASGVGFAAIFLEALADAPVPGGKSAPRSDERRRGLPGRDHHRRPARPGAGWAAGGGDGRGAGRGLAGQGNGRCLWKMSQAISRVRFPWHLTSPPPHGN